MSAKTVRRLLRAIHAPCLTISPLLIHILAELAHRPNITLMELGRRCHRPGRTIEKPIGHLRVTGYLEPKIGRPRDGKPSVLIITEQGWELLRALELAVVESKPSIKT